jgi:hypothetical protein
MYEEVQNRTEEITLQCKMVELYMLKQDKNRKYNCPVQLAVYGHTVEGTIYLTVIDFLPCPPLSTCYSIVYLILSILFLIHIDACI